jgi:hypothetical protein
MPDYANPNKEETNLKTFNTAKKFAEEVLFPLMFDFKKFQRQANFGSEVLNDSLDISEEIKDIQRFNGLKAMAETTHDLLKSISSTVQLKGNKSEIAKLNEVTALTDRIKILFYEHKEKFFVAAYRGTNIIDVLDRLYFEKIKDIIDTCYINTEILMTRNKLLFADAMDDYLSDDELKEAIKKEYIEG